MPGAIIDNLENGVDGHPLAQPQQGEAAIPVAQQAAVAGHPHRPILVVRETEDVAGVHRLVRPDRLRTVACDPHRTVGGAHPDIAVARLVERHHVVARESVLDAEVPHRPTLQAHQATRRPDPQRVRSGSQERAYLVAAGQPVG